MNANTDPVPTVVAGTSPDVEKIASEDRRIGVTLSGGGVRATFYSLGVLKYLVDSGLNKDVKVVSSVSGGSIANLVAATSSEFSSADSSGLEPNPSGFDRDLSMAATYLANVGIFFLPKLARVISVVVFLTIMGILATIVLTISIEPDDPGLWIDILAFSILSFCVSLPLALWLLLGFGLDVQRRHYASFVRCLYGTDEGFPAPGLKDHLAVLWSSSVEMVFGGYGLPAFASYMSLMTRLLGPDDGRSFRADTNAFKVSEFLRKDRWKERGSGDSGCWHIICATDLTSGQPVYMCRDWVYSPAYGWSTSHSVPVIDMVYASAAFPGAFSPLRLRADKMEFSRGSTAPSRLPDTLVVADGGVYNNLGTEVLDLAEDLRSRPLRKPGRISVPEAVSSAIVVNSGAPLRPKKISGMPIVRNLMDLLRINTVMYNSTLGPRLVALGAKGSVRPCAILEIGSSPVALARRLATEAPDPEMKRRAQQLYDAMASPGAEEEEYWSASAEDAAGTPTTLWPIGLAPARELCRLGYASAGIAAYVLYGHDSRSVEAMLSDLFDDDRMRRLIKKI